MNALATGGKSADGQFVGRGSRGRNDEDFSVRFFRGKERGCVIEQRGVGAGMNERARGQTQLYVADRLLTCAVQSVRSAVIGSVRAAVMDGARAAAIPHVIRSAATMAMVRGSRARV